MVRKKPFVFQDCGAKQNKTSVLTTRAMRQKSAVNFWNQKEINSFELSLKEHFWAGCSHDFDTLEGFECQKRSEKAFDERRRRSKEGSGGEGFVVGGKRRRPSKAGGAQELLQPCVATEEKGFLVSVGSSNIPFSLLATLKEDRATTVSFSTFNQPSKAKSKPLLSSTIPDWR